VTPVQAFYSINERTKPPADRVYHNNNACVLGQEIRPTERLPGTHEYRQCEECARLTKHPQIAQSAA
jgi:hypothetical protein